MDKRLQRSIDDGDFYSAHQLLISHSQRLERSGKLAESQKFLTSGIHSLVSAQAPAATFFDVVSKYMSIASKCTENSVDVEAELILILQSIVRYRDIPPNYSQFWAEFAAFACKFADQEIVCNVLLTEVADVDSVLRFMVKCCPLNPSAFSCAGEVVSAQQLVLFSLNLICIRCYGSAKAMAESFASKNSLTNYKTNSCIVYEESGDAAKSCNLLVLLSELTRRRNPPREQYVQLQLRYADLLKDESVKLAWNSTRDVFWPPKQQPGQVNPLASLFQSMMMNQ
ncbi:hypothetical protein PSACC_00360 [Paramicrosporidium saccamoebae]|uniref:Uncharacterized protein n=1 Tax=Paramicrosporidium saccamoebae TaxID=1246581 RepID=A0A2H9TPW9_9FUNG|nr:hypothetical protein PSACC_00360 [Paramicrosporidium saccamoebae]